jgi:hypothetical protein
MMGVVDCVLIFKRYRVMSRDGELGSFIIKC